MAHTPSKPAAPVTAFQPYIAANMSVAEFTIRAIILGALFGLIFGASTVYLGLRAGLTVSASIPIAVLAISVLKRLGGSTILENNIVQTIGSAGESLASGVVFTIPALIFLLPYGPAYFNYTQILLLAFAGGILGVLMMVPLRRALIVKEHGVLPYPEGTACADVLVAGEKGGALATTVFMGLGIGATWKALSWIVQLFRTEVGHSMSRTSFYPNATVNVDISPEYMGVGYVIGPRIAGVMFAGGVLSWLVLVPLLSILGQYIPEPFPPIPASGLKLSEMSAGQIWSAYIRYIGAGAVLAGWFDHPGPDAAHHPGQLQGKHEGAGRRRRRRHGPHRTGPAAGRRPARHAGAGHLPGRRSWPADARAPAGRRAHHPVRLLLRQRLVAHHGPDRQLVEPDLGHDHRDADPDVHGLCGDRLDRGRLCAHRPLRRRGGLHRGGHRGATSQDLKTGFLVGATPKYQQIGLIIGVLTSALVIGYTTLYLHSVMGIGSQSLPAPQATLMSTIIKGLLSQNLPWGLVLCGVSISIVLELCGIHSLSFAVGSYLPIATTAPIFAGGVVRWCVERKTGVREESDISAGTLFSSGLIAGGSLAGIVYAVLYGRNLVLAADDGATTGLIPFLHEGTSGEIAGMAIFFALAVVLFRAGQRKMA